MPTFREFKGSVSASGGREIKKSKSMWARDLLRAKGRSSWRGITMRFPHRRDFMRLAASTAALSAVPPIARADAYPSRPVRLIVGFPPGGANDVNARLIGQWLSERLGQAFVIENRPGAGSNIGTELVVRSAPDGYTLLLVAPPAAINATLYENLTFNFARDIAPVGSLTREPLIMAVNPSVRAKTVPEFIALAKASPGTINMASSGNGTIVQVAGELFKMTAGVDMIHVPYKGAGPALTDLLGGQVQVMFATAASSIEQVKAGRLRALAVTTAARVDVLPHVPTVGEFIAGYEASGFYGLGAPKSTPFEIIDKLNTAINAGLADPRIMARIADVGGLPVPLTPTEFGKLIADETEKWAKVIKFAGIKAE
jgi:tripartite-type tricarboxylate transporter receptor subunit TctC